MILQRSVLGGSLLVVPVDSLFVSVVTQTPPVTVQYPSYCQLRTGSLATFVQPDLKVPSELRVIAPLKLLVCRVHDPINALLTFKSAGFIWDELSRLHPALGLNVRSNRPSLVNEEKRLETVIEIKCYFFSDSAEAAAFWRFHSEKVRPSPALNSVGRSDPGEVKQALKMSPLSS